jgi:hypothetical protein
MLNPILEIDENDEIITCSSVFKKIYYNISYKIRLFWKNRKKNKQNEYFSEYLCR